MAKQTDLARKIAELDAEIDRLIGIRAFLESAPPASSDKPKRVRKPRGVSKAPKDMTAQEINGL